MKPRRSCLDPRSVLVAGVVLAAAASGVVAQTPELVKRRDAKLASEFLQKGRWALRLERARADAKRTGRPIFGYFTRSYAP